MLVISSTGRAATNMAAPRVTLVPSEPQKIPLNPYLGENGSFLLSVDALKQCVASF